MSKLEELTLAKKTYQDKQGNLVLQKQIDFGDRNITTAGTTIEALLKF